MVLFHLWYFPPYFFCKVNANERNGKEILSFYLLRSMISIIFIPSSNHLPIIFISSFMPSLYLSSVLVRSRFYDFAPSSSRARSHLCPLFIYKKWGSEQAQHPLLPHSLYIKSEIKNTPLYISSEDKNHSLYISSEDKIILYISLPKIKIILYPRAKNRHHPIYFLGTKVSQVWSS